LSQTFVLAPQALKLLLVIFALHGLILPANFLSHQMITDQRPGEQPNGTADQSSDRGVTHCATDDRTGSGTETRTYQAALLARGNRRGTASDHND
jgi:hypothetical protein